jgi:hypothetical protein
MKWLRAKNVAIAIAFASVAMATFMTFWSITPSLSLARASKYMLRFQETNEKIVMAEYAQCISLCACPKYIPFLGDYWHMYSTIVAVILEPPYFLYLNREWYCQHGCIGDGAWIYLTTANATVVMDIQATQVRRDMDVGYVEKGSRCAHHNKDKLRKTVRHAHGSTLLDSEPWWWY